MTPEKSPALRRVIVGMDPSSDPALLLDVTRELALAINAAITGIFVEDESLFDISSLPFARGMQRGALTSTSYNITDMQLALARHAAVFEKALSALQLDAPLAKTYKSLRGSFASEIPSAAGEHDLMVIQATPTGLTLQDMVSEARRMADKAGGIVLCVERRNLSAGPVVAIDDGDAPGIETVRLAASLAVSGKAPLLVFVLAKDAADAERIIDRNMKVLNGAVTPVVRVFMNWQLSDIADALRKAAPGYVVADLHGEPFVDNEAANTLLRAARSPAILLNVKA